MDEYIEAGKITSAHSFHGEVKIQSWCDTPGFLLRFETFYLDKTGGSFITVEKIRAANNLLIASFKEIKDEESAFKFKNRILYIKKRDANLEDGVYFVEDLINLPVFDFDTGEKYGVLSDIFNGGAGDIYVVRTDIKEKNKKNIEKTKEVMIPNVREFVKKVSLAEGVFITPIEGMF
ncbi:MAG: ribosome maturation factor RimM [Oscillospiraceae bacterium]|nr:ribosome maturation factor RimM [Oscillospiraceae bacterium]